MAAKTNQNDEEIGQQVSESKSGNRENGTSAPRSLNQIRKPNGISDGLPEPRRFGQH